MPAVRPAHLEAQLGEIEAAFQDPEGLLRRCLDLLEFYSSRVRQVSGAGRSGSLRSLEVPVTVVRELERRLLRSAAAHEHAAALAAERLWGTSLLETRLLGIALLTARPIDELPEWVAAWSQTADDGRLLERLAEGPLRRLGLERPELLWSTLAQYTAARSSRLTTLAWMALRAIIPHLDAADLPRLYDALAAAPAADAGEAWRARVGALEAAGRRSPAETARFLLDELDRGRPGTAQLLRQVLPSFPAREQAALRTALRRIELP
jgi:hypothetical protein